MTVPQTIATLYQKAREGATNPKSGLTREEVCLCAEALIAGYVSNLVPFKTVNPWYFTREGTGNLRTCSCGEMARRALRQGSLVE